MASQSLNSEIPSGFALPSTPYGEYNQIAFAISQALTRLNTSIPVEIISCTNSGGLSPVGFVDVKPLINQVDSEGKSIEHETIFNIPYLRYQGGVNAVIIDPAPGDNGICCFSSRDISKFKSTKKRANPNSWRQFSFSDGIYIGGILNGTPSRFIRFDNSGIEITTAENVTVNCNQSVINCNQSNVNAETSAEITSPSIKLGASGQSLLSFVTSSFMALFNGHDHNYSGGTTSAPNQQMSNSQLTTTVKGA